MASLPEVGLLLPETERLARDLEGGRRISRHARGEQQPGRAWHRPSGFRRVLSVAAVVAGVALVAFVAVAASGGAESGAAGAVAGGRPKTAFEPKAVTMDVMVKASKDDKDSKPQGHAVHEASDAREEASKDDKDSKPHGHAVHEASDAREEANMHDDDDDSERHGHSAEEEPRGARTERTAERPKPTSTATGTKTATATSSTRTATTTSVFTTATRTGTSTSTTRSTSTTTSGSSTSTTGSTSTTTSGTTTSRTTSSTSATTTYTTTHPSGPSPTIFCWSHLQPDTYEETLIKKQFEKRANIFACNDYAVISTKSILVGHTKTRQIFTWVNAATPVGMGEYGKNGQKTDSFLNTETFLMAWDTLMSSGVMWPYDFVVKVDPDAVFFPDRLRKHMLPYVGQNVYVPNCGKWASGPKLYGSIEVFSTEALQTYAKRVSECKSLPWHGWGEDYYMQHCMDLIGVKMASDFEQVGDERCVAAPCSDWTKVAYHDFKTLDDWMKCFNEAIGA